MGDSQGHPRRVYGVDFSGAARAGEKIWIAGGVFQGVALRIEECRRAESLPGSAKDRDRCLAALRDFIGKQQGCAFGLDFPFGLPRALVRGNSWEGFLQSFPEEHPSVEKFRETCRAAAGGRELKRWTDRVTQTPFSPCNLRLYRQTYFGIRDVLCPLVRDQLASVLPMQTALPGRAWIMEICPAATLKQQNLYKPYKGQGASRDAARGCILKGIEKAGPLSIPAFSLRSTILSDRDGDALDSVIAAFATFRALRNRAGATPGRNDDCALEGYVFV
ncbi:MAG: hypothetical protein HY652_04480 [Acidobacteria bacterium]|nr:hypothetical protein [Acidobacteriota bacterium]